MNVLILDCSDGCTTLYTVYVKQVKFMVYKLSLNHTVSTKKEKRNKKVLKKSYKEFEHMVLV